MLQRFVAAVLLTAGILLAFSHQPRSLPQDFPRALARLLVHEGGNDDDPVDRGGRTSRGIIQREYDRYRVRKGLAKRDVWTADQAEIVDIYHGPDYWQSAGVRGDELPAGLDYLQFDIGVLSGIARSGKALRQVLRIPTDDWHITDEVLRTTKARGALQVIRGLCAWRVGFYEAIIAANPSQERFRRGWMRRARESCAFAESDAGVPRGIFEIEELKATPPTALEPMGKAVLSADEIVPGDQP